MRILYIYIIFCTKIGREMAIFLGKIPIKPRFCQNSCDYNVGGNSARGSHLTLGSQLPREGRGGHQPAPRRRRLKDTHTLGRGGRPRWHSATSRRGRPSAASPAGSAGRLGSNVFWSLWSLKKMMLLGIRTNFENTQTTVAYETVTLPYHSSRMVGGGLAVFSPNN